MEHEETQQITPDLLLDKSFLTGLVKSGRFPFTARAKVGSENMTVCYFPPEEVDMRRDGSPSHWVEGRPVWDLRPEGSRWGDYYYGIDILLTQTQVEQLDSILEEIENE